MLKKINNKGFTIIEVLIVLAIAGAIMLVVFLAVPQLQRSSRNTQRDSEAALITAGVNECLANRQGVPGSCDAFNNGATPPVASELALTIDLTKFKQLTGTPTVLLSSAGYNAPTTVADSTIVYTARCNADGSGITAPAGTSSRQFVLMYNSESASGGIITKCISG